MLARQQVVNFVKIDRIETPMQSPDLFEYREDKGWRWLQRAAFTVLGWIGAHHGMTATTFQRTARENDNLLRSLLGQEGQWIEHVHEGRERMRIYMGPDDEMDLMRLVDFRDMQAATFVGRIKTQDAYGSKWHDIPITVVPWMTGAIIVPA